MTYADQQESIADGNLIQLFRFSYGIEQDQVLAYTTALDAQIVDHGAPVGEVTYQPVPIERDKIISNGTLDRTAINIGMDIGTDLAEEFRIYPPSSVVNLVIYEGHIDDPDGEFVVVWAGRVIAAERSGSKLNLSGEPITTQLRRPGLRRHYQFGCPHALFSTPCGANKAAATVSSTVAAISGTIITAAAAWEGAFEQSDFIRGMVEWTPAGSTIQRRTILGVDGDQISLTGIPLLLEVGDPIDIILRCNHRAYSEDGGDCERLHNNIQNFGGQPYIPLVNVIQRNPFY